MLTATQAAVLNNKIAGQLSDVGKGLMPTTKSNVEGIAWDYLIATKVEAYGKKAKEAAVKEAVKAKLIFDHAKHPKEPGFNEPIYTGDNVQIMCMVKNGSVRLNSTKLVMELKKIKGLTEDQIDKAMLAAADITRAPHTFTPSLITAAD